MRLATVVGLAVLGLTLAGCNNSEVDPVYTKSAVGSASAEQVAQWDEAFAWGDHRDGGYLTTAAFAATPAAAVSSSQVSAWDTAASWGDHRDAGYLTVAAFAATPAAAVSSSQVSAWDTAASWGDHRDAGYLTVAAFATTPAAAVSSAQVSAWDTAASWGDHHAAGYLTAEADPKVGTLTDGKLCTSVGGKVDCTSSASFPALTLTDGAAGSTTRVFSGSGANVATYAHTLFTLPSHTSAIVDLKVLVHDVNSNTNQRFFHVQYSFLRQWTNAPTRAVLATHYDVTLGEAITIDAVASGNDIQVVLNRSAPSSSYIKYKIVATTLLAQ